MSINKTWLGLTMFQIILSAKSDKQSLIWCRCRRLSFEVIVC